MKKGAMTALLLFGMFFGAGNLIFPPSLGVLSGQHFWQAIAGFILSGVGIAVLTLIVGTMNPKGYSHEIAQKVSPLFATVFLVAIYLSIGPFFAIPRTATTAFDVGILPLLPQGMAQVGLAVFTTVYFLAAYVIALNPFKILDSIGKLLTPVFALLIVVLVVLGIIRYGGQAAPEATGAYQTSAFGTGFIEGYNTLDSLASVAFSVVAVSTLQSFGFTSKKEYVRTIWSVGAFVALGFSALYLGLAFLGNHFPVPTEVVADDSVNKGVYVLSQATQAIFGSGAQLFLAAMVTMTCFTTTAGLIVSTGEFFHQRFPRFSYKLYASLFTLIGFAIANLGLTAIIRYSIPVLLILYPITICLVMIILVNKFLPLSKIGMQLTVGGVTVLSMAAVLAPVLHLTALSEILSKLPLANLSLPWLLPALLGIIASLFLPGRQKSQPLEIGL